MKQFKVTLIKSLIGRDQNHQKSVKGLGLRRIRHSVTVPGTPENMGMIQQVRYLLDVQEV
jgi:large subunit ribosomal protein L30